MVQKILISKILFYLILIFNFSVLAQEKIEGNAKVIDGDSIKIKKNNNE